MDLVVFENNKPLVIDEFRAGRFDYVELASDIAETKFFQFLFGAGIVDKLAQDFPTPRERELVPRWMYLSSQLSLRLHGQHAYHGYPLIIRVGVSEGIPGGPPGIGRTRDGSAPASHAIRGYYPAEDP